MTMLAEITHRLPAERQTRIDARAEELAWQIPQEKADLTGTVVRINNRRAKSIADCRKMSSTFRTKEPTTGDMYRGRVIAQWRMPDENGRMQCGITAILTGKVKSRKTH